MFDRPNHATHSTGNANMVFIRFYIHIIGNIFNDIIFVLHDIRKNKGKCISLQYTVVRNTVHVLALRNMSYVVLKP